MRSIQPLHDPFNSHGSTQSCLHQSCTENHLTDLSSTTDESSDSLEAATMTRGKWTTASAYNMWNEEEEEDDDNDDDVAIWDRPLWVTSLVRLRWCCRPAVSTLSHDRRLSSSKHQQRQLQQQSQRPAQAFNYHPTHHASFSHLHSHTLLTNGTQLLSPTEMEYVIPPYSPAYAYSSGYSRYQQQPYQQQQQQQLQPYPYMSPLSPLACYPSYPLSFCTASVETCSDLSMDTSQRSNYLSPAPTPSTPTPTPPRSSTKQKEERSILRNPSARATTEGTCSNVKYPPPPLSPEKKSKKLTVRNPSKSRRRSLSSLAPKTPPRSHFSPTQPDRRQQNAPVVPQASPAPCPIGKPPLPPVGSSSSLVVPPLNNHQSNHTQTTTTTNTPSTATSYNGGPTSPSPPVAGCAGGPSRVRILSEFSRASMISSSSRHRRQHHDSFEFSMSSLNQINSLNAAADMDPALLRPEVPPCLFIEVDNNCNSSQQDFDDDGSQQRPRHYSWSSWDDEDKYQGGASSSRDDNDSFANEDHDDDDDDDENHVLAASAFATKPMQNFKGHRDDEPPSGPSQSLLQQQQSLENPPLVPRIVKPPIAQREISALSDSSFPSPLLSTRKGRSGTEPLYLPICPLLDSMVQDGRVVVSGWAAVSLDARLHQELTVSSESASAGANHSCSLASLKRSDLAYVQLIQLDRSTYKLCIHRRGLEEDEEQDNQGNGNNDDDNVSCASMVDSLLLTSSLQVSSEEVGGRAGKCIQLRSSDNILCTLLPVSLPDHFFCAGSNRTKLVSHEEFSNVQQCMFTPFSITGTSSSSRQLLETSSLSLSESSSSCSSTCATSATFSSAAPSQSGENNNCVAWGGREYYRRRFAPDEQHDATRHLLFALDTAVRQSGPTSLY